MEAERPDPEILMKEYELEGNKKDGKLKIFFGYAAGVGKTYAMLEAAHHAKNMGIDVVAGYIEPHTRPETVKLLEGIEELPKKEINYKGITLSEFDLDEALLRKPKVILVDELAHTNAEGCRHQKRYQDIAELMRAGIHVYTTVNVQHLESLNDLVSSITGIVVNERVPDYIFDEASQVEVIDIEPEDLLERLREGKVYKEAQTQKALTGFFSKKNLEALREIALRRTADCLNRKTEEAFGKNKKNAGEHILVCISNAPSNPKVIRMAVRMAEAFHCNVTALNVETSFDSKEAGLGKSKLLEHLKLAEDLGCRIATVYGDDIAVQIAEYAKIGNITKIVVGRTNHGRSIFTPTSKSLINKLTNLAPNLDIYIIPDNQPKYKKKKVFFKQDHPRATPLELLKSVAVIPVATATGFLFYNMGFSEANIITVYILGVLISAIWTSDKLYGFIISMLSVLTFNFFFTEPRFSMEAYGAGYPITFLIMFLASFITSNLAIRVKNQAYQAAKKAYRTQILLETNQKLQKAETINEIVEETANQTLKLLGKTVVFYIGNGKKNLHMPRVFLAEECHSKDQVAFMSNDEKAVAQWVYENNKHAGATTSTLPSAKCLYLAVRGQDEVFAVAGIYMPEGERVLEAFEKNLLIALLGECGLALEKITLMNEKRRIEIKAKQEQLRANLLRGISHDLRTPLTSISGNAGILMGNSIVLDEDKKNQLYTDIYDDSMWLINLVENLLSVTRIENGTMNLHMEPELVEDLFYEALGHLDRKAAEHDIQVQVHGDILMAEVDARLIVQVIINIVNNAIKYTPEGSEILVSARKNEKNIVVEIADTGSGIDDVAKAKLFEMFFTVENNRLDGRRGLGLGLSLCKSIINAHEGNIYVKDNTPKGTIIGFTLKAAEVRTHE